MISLRRILPVLLAVFCVAGSAQAGGRPVVVELFTSQGCSSCPPADMLLGRLAQRPGVIAISLPITYWDMLGWKDTLASEANTRRQKAYAAAMGHGGVYTPQIVVDGVADVVGSRVSQVEAAIVDRRAQLAVAMAQARDIARVEADAERAADDARGTPTALAVRPVPDEPPAAVDAIVPVTLWQTPQELRIDIGAAPGAHNATVWLFQLRSAVSVTIPTGENAGHTITYHNVASDLRAVGVYRGRALSLSLPGKTGVQHDSVAVVVQQGGFGHVLGAAMISRPNYYAAQ
jgi:hypothetical protein